MMTGLLCRFSACTRLLSSVARSGPAASNFYAVEPQVPDACRPKRDLVESGFYKLPRVFYAQVNFDLMKRRQDTIKYAGDHYGRRPKRMSMAKRAVKYSYETLMRTPQGIHRLHKHVIDDRDRVWPFQ